MYSYETAEWSENNPPEGQFLGPSQLSCLLTAVVVMVSSAIAAMNRMQAKQNLPEFLHNML